MVTKQNAIRIFSMGLSLSGAGILASAGPALAQSAPYLEYSNIYGTGKTITITRLPISTPGGFVSRDAVITVTADGDGTLKAKISAQAASPPLMSTSIQAGVYGESESSGNQIRISGPVAIGGDEAKWTTVTAGGFPCGSPADFYTGPLNENPLYSRLQAAGVTDTAYSYGIIAEGSQCSDFSSNSLIGVAQMGSQVEVALFTNPKSGKDQSTPYERYIFNFAKP